MVFRTRETVSSRRSDTLLGAGLLLGVFSLGCFTITPFVTFVLAVHYVFWFLLGLVVLKMWLSKPLELRLLGCILLTLPVLWNCGLTSAVPVFLTTWYTHVGLFKRLGITEEPIAAPPETANGS